MEVKKIRNVGYFTTQFLYVSQIFPICFVLSRYVSVKTLETDVSFGLLETGNLLTISWKQNVILFLGSWRFNTIYLLNRCWEVSNSP